MPKKLKLSDLKVQSFVTNLEDNQKKLILAGAEETNNPEICSQDICPTLGCTNITNCTCHTECPVTCLPTTRPCLY